MRGVAPGAQVESVGRYRLLESIGTGGMAEVFRARGAGLGRAEREVAVKMVHPHLAHERVMVELFHREAQVASTLAHPNLVTVLESGLQDGRCYLVMEYVDGVDLRGLLRRVWGHGGSLPIGVAVAIASAMCAGLHHAHERCDEHGQPLQIVHRDVSPGNVLVSRDGAVKVSDFGVAKAMASWSAVHSAHGTIRGKLAYMAPEQARGDEVDRRADVFSVGSVLFEMLTRARAVKGDEEVVQLHALVYGDVPAVRSSRPDCPASLAAVVERALQRDPDARWPSALAMQQALERSALDEGCFVTPSALADFVAETMRSEPRAEAVDDAVTRVHGAGAGTAASVAGVDAGSERSAAEPTETLGDVTGWGGSPAPSDAVVRRGPGRWIAASLVVIAGLGGLGWWVRATATSAGVDDARDPPRAHRPGSDAVVPAPVAAPASPEASERPVEPDPPDESDPPGPRDEPDPPEASTGPGSASAPAQPSSTSRRPRRSRPRKKRRSAKPASTIDPSETLFPVNE